ncbi:MAG: cytochrome c1 [Gammaproteobacteria bacterium]|nr:cytochrome c1 [Gammaproteobacteria bacterium]
MKKTALLLILLAPGYALAAGGSSFLFKTPNIDETDKAAIQRGARVFVNYCLTCHSAEYMRYKRVADDLGISEEIMKKNLMNPADKFHDGMTVAIEEDDAKRWFGVPPPDLSVISRARGRDWLYNYFMTFYKDESSPIGVNNATFKDVAMPNVLWELQGWQEPVYADAAEHGESDGDKQIVGMKLVETGKLTPKEYQQTVRDLVTYMVYMGEPAELKRHEIGFWVLAFLFVFLMISYALKREYWKDIH